MRKLLYFFTVSIVAISIVGCSKELSTEISTGNNGNNGSGGGSGNGGSGSGGTSTGNYQPMTAGSYWKLKDSATGVISQMTATNKTKTINGKTFTAFFTSNPAPNDTIFYSIQGPSYFLYEAGVSASGATGAINFNYLDDAASVGYNWQYVAGQGNGFTSEIKTTIVERNISVTIGSNTFTNVIHTHMEMFYNIMGTLQSFADYDVYIAKDIGIVRMRSSLMGGVMTTCSDLVDYHIN